MKTLRFIFSTAVLLLLTVGISSAQGKKTTETASWDWNDYFDCAHENIVGVESVVVTHWDGKIQFRYKGSYTGATSGKSYSWSLLENYSFKNYVPGKAYSETYTSTSVVECEGMPVAIAKYRYHVTVNAGGEVTVEKEDSSGGWICL